MSRSYPDLCRTWDPWSHIPPYYNLGVALTRGPSDKPAILWENASGRTGSLTYAQLDALSNRVASSLANLGVKPGERVFLRLPNLPEFYVAALATARCGAIFVPSSTQLREAEVRYRLQDAEAVAAVTTARLAETIDHVRADCPALQQVFVVPDEPGTSVSKEHIPFDRLVQEGSESFSPVPTRSDDVAFLAYTSGTTGEPKGVVHLQRYPLGYEGLIRFWHDYRPEDVVACPSELGWLLPVASTFLYALSHGLTVVLFDTEGGRFDSERWFALFQKYRITNFTATPTVYRMLLTEADAAKHYDLSAWRHAVSAGEPLPADTLQAVHQHLGVTVLDGLGMSECMVYAHNLAGAGVKPGSCGRPTPGVRMELMDEDMNPVPAGQEGVLCVSRASHPGMMREYWRKPERTAEVFRGDWYYSGDLLTRDEDGYMRFKGRSDDVIKASGYRISPFEVESCLVSHPAVLEAAAVAVLDPLRGSVVKAFLVLRQGLAASLELQKQIQEFAREQMAPYKQPRQIEFLEALPKTASGKIKRRELRERQAQ
jgi:acetyl-CoA synthetase